MHQNDIGTLVLSGVKNRFKHTTDKFIIHLDEIKETQETIIDIFKNSIMDLKPTIKEELERKCALKVVIALHAAFYQSTDPTFLTESHPVFKSLPLESLLATDIDQVLHTMIEQILKSVDEYEERESRWVFTPTIATRSAHVRVHPSLCIDVNSSSQRLESKGSRT